MEKTAALTDVQPEPRGEFTKTCTLIAKGLAMVMMVMFHVQTAEGNFIPIGYATVGGDYASVEEIIGRFCKICVAMFTVLSGYGIYLSTHKLEGHELSRSLLTRAKNLYITYWKTFALFLLVTLVLGVWPVDGARSFVLNLLGLRYDYCGYWWYVLPYIFLILLSPFVMRVLARKHALVTTDCFWVFILWTFSAFAYPAITNWPIMVEFAHANVVWDVFFWVSHLLPSFMMGAVIAKYDLFAGFWRLFRRSRTRISVSIALLAIAFICRVTNGFADEIRLPEFFYATLFIAGSVTIIKAIPFVRNVFVAIGKMSTYMWLLHGLFIYYLVPKLPRLPFGAPLMVLVVLVGSFVLAWGMTFLDKQIKQLASRKA